jgi:hypothetical protein
MAVACIAAGWSVAGAQTPPPKPTDRKPDPPPAPNTISPAEKAAGWKLLFDGKSLKGWHALGFKQLPAGFWTVESGTISRLPRARVPVKADGPALDAVDLITDSAYTDFQLSFEWKVTPGANSGVTYNVDEQLSITVEPTHAAKGFEYRILDDNAADDNKLASHRSGALYDLIAPNDKKLLNPVGEWNRSAIILLRDHGEQWLNGQKVLEFELGSAGMDSVLARSTYHTYPAWFAVRRKGHLVLQDHGDVVWFRSIKIREFGGR